MNSLSKDQYTPTFNSNSTRRIDPTGQWSNTIAIEDHTSKPVTLEVNGRDVMKELDEMRDALLLLKRDVDMEAKYPELKQAYDEYRKILDELTVMEKLTT